MPSELTHHLEAIWQAVAPGLPGFTVELLPSVDSTNSELMRRARAGLNEPILLVAEDQTAGRGRMGKTWLSRPGQSLTFSLALPMAPANWSGLSLAVGVSLAEQLHPDVMLKWPNDLWLYQRKLGGILTETAHLVDGMDQPRLVVIGVGINIARPQAGSLPLAAAPGAQAPMAPAGLSEVCVGQTAGETLLAVLPALVRDMQQFETDGFAAFAHRFAARDGLAEQSVTLSDGAHGLANGVDGTGALRVHTASGWRAVSSSEVSVRPC